ncbi:MAG: DUF6931 family protein [Planctomycetota bacterium]|jgi:hypothetical protein
MKKLSDIFGGIFAKGEEPTAITEPFKLITGRTVAEICADFELQEEAKAHLSGEPMPHEFVDRLIRARLYSDAMRFLAYGLPKREAVWWATLCVKSVPACCDDEIATEAMQAAEVWIKNPTDVNREAALTAGSKHNFEMPGALAAWTAMAAGWSARAAASGDETMEVSAEHLTAHAASGAIILAAGIDPERAEEVSLKFLETGVQIAQGKI